MIAGEEGKRKEERRPRKVRLGRQDWRAVMTGASGCPYYHLLPLLLLLLTALLTAAPFNQVPDEQEVDHESWERSPELWAPQDADLQLIRSRPSGPARPYGLSRAVGDYQYAPKPKHRRPDRLLSLLGASYDPFWMTEEEPHRGGHREGRMGTLSRELADSMERYRGQLAREVAELPLPALPAREPNTSSGAWELREAASILRHWLVDLASCGLTSSWVDLGPVFWPRWVRHTDCDESPPACSWPPGMTCRPAQTMHIKLLAWHCWLSPRLPPGQALPLQQCAWRQVLYPVVAACKCSCR
ncbi:noggin-like [Callospermophilus lateralis]|uniref:noggin-like n=1 Tax=Callospermophilus lateralis TaxID=76772 RepID=UPI004053D007